MSWNDYEISAEKGPFSIIMRVFFLFLIMGIIIGIIGYAISWFSETGKVAKEEFGARALLEKYEWFKNASATLDKQKADIQVYEKRISMMEEDYKNLPRNKWSREDREQCNVWKSEVAGIIAGYNGLVAEYNAQMAKFNWRFANAGMLPEGATEPVRRKYKEYKIE
ncbi:hypothetical protein J4403_00915 [Candidatus Woesearchaeota archaeon]|nr:hypothetical protein [Candidatus Woesearchaeota archaeon]